MDPVSRLTEFFKYMKKKQPKLANKVAQLMDPKQVEKWTSRCEKRHLDGHPVIPIIYRISSRIIRQESLPKVSCVDDIQFSRLTLFLLHFFFLHSWWTMRPSLMYCIGQSWSAALKKFNDYNANVSTMPKSICYRWVRQT